MSTRWRFSFRPRLFDALADYDRGRFLSDLNAGLVVGVVALSLCIGLGVASGVSPAAGLYTGIVGGFLISALGGSRVQIGGPAGAFVGLVAVISAQYGFANLLVCTAMAGIMMFVMGALRLGALIKFIPYPLTMGFTCGIAVVIMATQVKELLGVELPVDPPHVLDKAVAIWRVLPSMDWVTILTGIISLGVLVFWPGSWQRRIPGSIAVVAAGTLAVAFGGLDLRTIGSAFGGIPQGFPQFAFPVIDPAAIGNLVGPAFAIAVLSGVESLLSAVVADGMIDDNHDSNQELMAQGVANMVSPLFGGIPVTGVIARTATNIRSGGSTPVAGIVHAVVLLLFILVAAPVAKHIPLVSLAAVLSMVAVRMGEWHEFAVLRQRPAGDVLVFLTAFALTVLVDLTWAVYVGMLLSAFVFIKQVTEATHVDQVGDERDIHAGNLPHIEAPEGVLVYRVFGSLLFGAADKLHYVLQRVDRSTKVVILHVEAVEAMDATALHRVESLLQRLKRHNRHLIISGARAKPHRVMQSAGLFDRMGRGNIVADLPAAVARARELIDMD